jgi:hypothetical protein
MGSSGGHRVEQDQGGELMVCGLYVYRSSGRRPLKGCVYEFGEFLPFDFDTIDGDVDGSANDVEPRIAISSNSTSTSW